MKQELLQLLSFIDLTSLNNLDNQTSILSLVEKANLGFEQTVPAAVCVFANHGDFVRYNLNASIKTAVVAGYFPSGQASLEAKIQELDQIVHSDIDEVDIVINRGELIAENYDFTAKEVELSKALIEHRKLKVILETGELTATQIAIAAKIAIESGADFVKTSTGKIATGATLKAAEIICTAIKDSGRPVGFKASGGIKTYEDAVSYKNIVEKILGPEYLNPALFRIGASSLYDNLIAKFKSL
jgi:deoxyribose-phosphate aldolase